MSQEKSLATKLKDSVDKPILINNNNDIKQPELTQDTQNQLNKASELPMPQPQLPKTISTAEEEGGEEEKIKSKPRIKMVTKKDSDIEVTRDEELPAMSFHHHHCRQMQAAESPSTEIPSTEIYSAKGEGKEGMAIEKRKLANEKRSSRNKSK